MIFADKLIQLRKKAGWSQEELAEQMNVTRQSVSKWEGAQSIPDLEKIIRLSDLFGVSSDYLLKDEIEDTEGIIPTDDMSEIRCVSMEEANAFLPAKLETSKSIAMATFLCIISPICLMILGALSEITTYGLKENVAGGVGMIILLVLVTVAVAMFILSGKKTAKYEYLEKEVFETAYGVRGMVLERQAQYSQTHTKYNIIGVSLCIMALVPLFTGAMIDDENELLLVMMLSLSFVIVGIGVVFLIISGIIWSSYAKLLQEGEYSKERKKNQPFFSTISVIYWSIVTAIFLGYSLSTNNWGYSWIIWVVAGVLSPAINTIASLLSQRK